MRRRTTTTLTAGALALAMAAGTALAGPGGPGRHGRRGPGMHGPRGPMAGLLRAVHRLDLSDQQKEQIRSILETVRTKVQAERQALRELRQQARSQDPGTFDEAAVRTRAREAAKHREEIAVTVAKARADIFKVLTPEQQEQLRTWRQQRAERRQRLRDCMEQMGPPPWAGEPGPPPEGP